MNWRPLVLTVLVASGAVALGAQSVQQAPPDPQPRVQQRAPRPMAAGPQTFAAPRERLKQELGLNDTQVATLEKLMGDERKAAIKRQADQRIARLELEELMRADTLNEQAIDAKIRQVTELQASTLRARVEQRVAMRKVLTPEQFQKWQQMRGRFGERAMRSRMHRDDRSMRWRDDRGRGWRVPPPPEAPRPPAGPGDEPIEN